MGHFNFLRVWNLSTGWHVLLIQTYKVWSFRTLKYIRQTPLSVIFVSLSENCVCVHMLHLVLMSAKLCHRSRFGTPKWRFLWCIWPKMYWITWHNTHRGERGLDSLITGSNPAYGNGYSPFIIVSHPVLLCINRKVNGTGKVVPVHPALERYLLLR
jgi:hypothetical protein